MKIDKLHLINFRSYKNLHISFPDKKLVFLTGKNGIGKTNIIEAVYFLSTSKSFRSVADRQLISFNQSFFSVKMDFLTSSQIRNTIKINFKEGQDKEIFLNSNKVSTIRDFYGNFLAVIFSPKDIELIDGAPQLRRKYIDNILSKFMESDGLVYFSSLLNYNRALKQRNALLKKIRKEEAEKKELDIWDKILIENGLPVSFFRNKFIQEAAQVTEENVNKISGQKKKIELKYISNFLDFSTTKDSLNSLSEQDWSTYFSRLRQNREADIFSGSTQIGPHRDDFQIIEDGKNISGISSQGQKRSFAIALKLVEYFFLKRNREDEPVLLIDDVITDLDLARKGAFFKLISEANQSIITTTDISSFQNEINNFDKSAYHLYLDETGLHEKNK